MADTFLLLREVAQRLRCSRGLLLRAVAVGELRVTNIGIGTQRRRLRIRELDLDAWLGTRSTTIRINGNDAAARDGAAESSTEARP